MTFHSCSEVLPPRDHFRRWSMRLFWYSLKHFGLHWLRKLWPFAWPWQTVRLGVIPQSTSKITVFSHDWRIERFFDRLDQVAQLNEEDEDRIGARNDILYTTFGPSSSDPLQFRLEVVPNFGGNEICFRLGLVAADVPHVEVYFNVAILDQYGHRRGRVATDNIQTFIRGLNIWAYSGGYFHNRIQRSDLLDPSKKLLPGGTATIRCEVTIIPYRSILSENEPVQTQEDDLFAQWIDDERFADVQLVAGEKEFNAHSAILATRSPVFREMLESQLVDGQLLIAHVDSNVFGELLRYIYTGKVDALNENARQLLSLAGHFQLDHLKDLCEQTLCTQLSPETMLDYYKLAEEHSANRIKVKAVNFIRERVLETLSNDTALLTSIFYNFTQEKGTRKLLATSGRHISFSHIWRIENFSRLTSIPLNNYIAVPKAVSCNFGPFPNDPKYEFYLQLETKGHYAKAGCISITLKHVSCIDPQVNALYQISVLDSNGRKYKTQSNYWHAFKNVLFKKQLGLDWVYIIPKQRLFFEKHDLLPNDTLTILCEVQIIEDRAQEKPIAEFKSSKFIENINLLNSDSLADVVLVIDGTEVRAHKMTLIARSPVFAAMFQIDMSENEENRVLIPDEKMPVFRKLLEYIYTGKVTQLEQFALQLMPIADKFQVDELKGWCEQCLASKLSIDNALDLLQLAKRYGGADLETKSLEFIQRQTEAAINWLPDEQWLIDFIDPSAEKSNPSPILL